MVWQEHHPWAGLPGNDSDVTQTAKMIRTIVLGEYYSFVSIFANIFGIWFYKPFLIYAHDRSIIYSLSE